MTFKIGVVTFPGTLDDRDAQRAVRLAGGEAVPLWHADANLHKVDAVVLPGGFSYGDYLRCGAIAAQAPVTEVITQVAGAEGLDICVAGQGLGNQRVGAAFDRRFGVQLHQHLSATYAGAGFGGPAQHLPRGLGCQP